MLRAITFLLLCTSFAAINGRKVPKCELVKTLRNHGIKNDLGTWVCIAKHESNFNTKAHNTQTGDFGILQISHLYWCNDGDKPGKECHATCKQFLNDDINDDVVCAKTVFDQTQKLSKNGFTAWVAYGKCKGDQSAYAKGC